MFNLKRLIILLIYCATISNGYLNTKLFRKTPKEDANFYKNFLKEIKNERNYDSLLIVQHVKTQDSRIQMIYSLNEPKLIISNQTNFYYRESFNNDIIAIIILQKGFVAKWWRDIIRTLDYMRQIRMLMIWVNIENTKFLQNAMLKECQDYKFTNVLMHFLNTSMAETKQEYLQLLPYPEYHFKVRKIRSEKREEYYPKHWLDMKGKILLTLPDQIVPRSLMYKDSEGKVQFTGFAGRLVKLFAQQYNATLKMPFEPKEDQLIHYATLRNMSKQGQLDIPMTVSPIFTSQTLKHMSYPTEVSKWMIMIPCARRMSICQVYDVILSAELFLIILVFTITFSLVHTIIEKLFYNQMIWLNLLMSDKVLPGILGQSFNLKKSHLLSLRLIYILIFIMGLYMSTLFSAHLQTLITSPPFGTQISTFEQLRLTKQKILLSIWDIKNMDENDYVLKEKMKGVIEYTDNATYFGEMRKTFNTTYGYTLTSALWQIYSNIQLYYVEKVFCVSPEMNIWDIVLFGVPLGEHSPYKEPLDYLVHKMHTAGLLRVWKIKVFNELLSLKKISLRDSSRVKTYADLTEHDLFFVWMILIIGWISSLLVFSLEIMVNCCMEFWNSRRGIRAKGN